MLKFIDRDLNPYPRTSIDSFLKMANLHDSIAHNSGTNQFILTEDSSESIFGGAALYKSQLPHLHKNVQKAIFSLAQGGEVWTCTVSLFLNNDFNMEQTCQVFYANLYQKLLEFGRQEKINYLYVILEPGEYLSTEAMGFWPYVLEIRPQDSNDGLFHGILSLTDSPQYLGNQESSLFTFSQLAA